MTLIGVLIDFALTGRIDPLHCGMTLAEAEDLLGPGRPHPAIQMQGPDLVVTKRTITGLWIRLRPGSTAKLPTLVLPDSEAHSATVLREEFLAELDAAGGRHEVNPILTFGTQSSVITCPGRVCAVFSLPGKDNHVAYRDRQYLKVLHKHMD